MEEHTLDPVEATAYASQWLQRLDASKCQVATEHLLRLDMTGVAATATGPDGLPYSTWAAHAHSSTRTLLDIHDRLSTGLAMPILFTDSILVCPPKPASEMTERGLAPRPN